MQFVQERWHGTPISRPIFKGRALTLHHLKWQHIHCLPGWKRKLIANYWELSPTFLLTYKPHLQDSEEQNAGNVMLLQNPAFCYSRGDSGMYQGRDKAWHRPEPELPSGICEQQGALNCLHLSIQQKTDSSRWGQPLALPFTAGFLSSTLACLWVVLQYSLIRENWYVKF